MVISVHDAIFLMMGHGGVHHGYVLGPLQTHLHTIMIKHNYFVVVGLSHVYAFGAYIWKGVSLLLTH